MKIRNFKVINAILTSLIIFIVFPIFVETFGCLLFKNDTKIGSDYASDSKLVYMVASIMGQIGYSLATRLNNGFLIFPIFECKDSFSKIYCEALRNNQNGFINALVTLFISTLLSSLFSFLCSVFKLGPLLKYVPLNIIVVINISTGLSFLYVSFAFFWTKKILMSLLCISISFLITFGDIILKKHTKNPKLSIVYIIFILLITSLLRSFNINNFLKSHNLIPKNKIVAFSIEDFCKKIHFEALDLTFPLRHISQIISIALFPIISFATSFPSYCEALGINASSNRELKSLSFANLLSAFACCPTYFNFSGSVFFSISGVNAPIYSFIAGLSMIYYYFFSHLINFMFSTFVNALLTEEIAIMILEKYIKLCFQFSLLDNCVIVFLLALYVILKANVFLFLIIAFFINFIVAYVKTGKLLTNINTVKEIKIGNELIYKIEDKLYFYNVVHLLNLLKKSGKLEAVIDLSDCHYVDLTANYILYNLKMAGITLKIINTNYQSNNNFYFWLF